MKSVFTFLALLFTLGINAQVTWNFGTAAPSSGVLSNSTVSNIAQGNNNGTTTLITTTSASTGYAGASGTQNAGAASFVGALNTASSTYFELTITPASGYTVSISSIALGSRSTATGPQLISIRSSVDAYATDATTAIVNNNSAWALASFGSFTLINGTVNTPVTLRIYGSNGTGTPAVNTANWRIDDLQINYAVSVAPITLKSFSATVNSNTINLKWLTANESNIKNYAVEKSENGINFTPIATISAKNNAENSYQYTDVAATKNTLYYRLKIEDNNGKIIYSSIARVDNIDVASKLFIYPTVATTSINAKLKADKNTLATIQIIDAIGKVTTQKSWNISTGINTMPIDITNLSKGVYRLRIVGENINEISSFLKN
jgi:hypothetical protein